MTKLILVRIFLENSVFGKIDIVSNRVF